MKSKTYEKILNRKFESQIHNISLTRLHLYFFSEDPDALDTYQYLTGQDIISSIEEKQNIQINFWHNLKFWLKVKSKATAEQIKTIGDQTEIIKIQPNIFEPIFAVLMNFTKIYKGAIRLSDRFS